MSYRKYWNKKVLIILVIIQSFQTMASSENQVTVQFENLELLQKGWQNRTFYFRINGQVLSPDSLIHSIKINTESFDELYFSFDSTFKDTRPVYSKLRAGNAYTLRINACSQYEFVPNENPELGQVRFVKKNTNQELYGGLCDSELLSNKPTKYYETCQSVMCKFSSVEISVSNADGIISVVQFHFLHAEKITATYNDDQKRIELKLEKD